MCGFWIIRKNNSAKKILYFAVLTNLFFLAYFKYADFIISTCNSLFDARFRLLKISLPIGISFFTFTQIAFLVDSYQGKAKEYNFIHYCLFVTYFPHLIAGPILHHKEMMSQFEDAKNYKISAQNIAVGLTIFTIGLAKKILLADNLVGMVNPVFAQNAHPHFIEAWFGVLAYSFQLYFDFSGYSDMAIGLSRLFGINLPLNFNSPYKAISISDFWQRWHMTLSRFLREYVYIPLVGNRYGQIHRYQNLMLTMLLGGLWHGAGYTFVVWGFLHGLYLIINHSWSFLVIRFKLKVLNKNHKIYQILTFLSVVIAWCFFRSPDVKTALDVSGALFFQNGLSLPIALKFLAPQFALFEFKTDFNGILWIDFGSVAPYVLFFSAVIAFYMPNTTQILNIYEANYKSLRTSNSILDFIWRPCIKQSILVAIIFAICVFNINKPSEFLYFQF